MFMNMFTKPTPRSHVESHLGSGYRSEAAKALKYWKALNIDWVKEFPDDKLKAPFDLVTDLLKLDVGKLYKKIAKNDGPGQQHLYRCTVRGS